MSESLHHQPNNVAFEAYEQWHTSLEDARGLEVTALTATEYHRATQDPATATITTMDEAGRMFEVPLATSIENLEWYNKQYFQDAAAASELERETPIVYYDHIPQLLAANRTTYIEALEPVFSSLARNKGLLAIDHLDVNASEVLGELQGILNKLQLDAADILPTFDPQPYHFNYASPATLANVARVRKQPLSLWEAYQSGVTLGEGAAVEQVLNDEEIDTVWQYYKERFDTLTTVDPIRANSPKEELAALFRNEQVLKSVQRLGGEIVSLTMYGDARLFPWANQRYYQQHFPEEYTDGKVWFFPGAITKSSSGGNIMPLIGAVGQIASAAGIERSVLSFVCNKVSRRPITTISNRAFNQSGLVTDTTQPVSRRVFHAFLLTKESN